MALELSQAHQLKLVLGNILELLVQELEVVDILLVRGLEQMRLGQELEEELLYQLKKLLN